MRRGRHEAGHLSARRFPADVAPCGAAHHRRRLRQARSRTAAGGGGSDEGESVPVDGSDSQLLELLYGDGTDRFDLPDDRRHRAVAVEFVSEDGRLPPAADLYVANAGIPPACREFLYLFFSGSGVCRVADCDLPGDGDLRFAAEAAELNLLLA